MNTNIPSHLLKTYHEDRINQDTNQSESFISATFSNLLSSVKMTFSKHEQSKPEAKVSTQTMGQLKQV